jgi:hypothetical protein
VKKAVLPCISPFGNNLNELYGVSEQIVPAFCPHSNSGQHWRSPSFWVVNDALASTARGLCRSAHDHPSRGLQGAVRGFEVSHRSRTPQEKIVVFPNDDSLFTGPATPVGGSATDVLISPITLGAVHLLSVRAHANSSPRVSLALT